MHYLLPRTVFEYVKKQNFDHPSSWKGSLFLHFSNIPRTHTSKPISPIFPALNFTFCILLRWRRRCLGSFVPVFKFFFLPIQKRRRLCCAEISLWFRDPGFSGRIPGALRGGLVVEFTWLKMKKMYGFSCEILFCKVIYFLSFIPKI